MPAYRYSTTSDETALATGYRFSTTIAMGGIMAHSGKHIGLFRMLSGRATQHKKTPSPLHLGFQQAMDATKRTVKKAGSLTPGHARRIAQRDHARETMIASAVLSARLRDEQKRARDAQQRADNVKAELKAEKRARQFLRLDLEVQQDRHAEQGLRLNELEIENKAHKLRLTLATHSLEAAKTDHAHRIRDLKNENAKLMAELGKKIERTGEMLTQMQHDIATVRQEAEESAWKRAAREADAARKIEALECELRQVEIDATERLACEKDKFERENSSLAWDLDQARKDFESERAHVNSMLDWYHWLEAANSKTEKENAGLVAERDGLHEKLQCASQEIGDTKTRISSVIDRMYQENPVPKKGPNATPRWKAFADYHTPVSKKIGGAEEHQRRAEKEVADIRSESRQLIEKTNQERKLFHATEREVSDCNAARKRAEFDIKQRDTELQAAQAENGRLQERCEDAERHLQSAHDTLGDALRETASTVEKAVMQLREDLDESKKNADAAVEQRKALDKVNEQDKAKIAELEGHIAKLTKQKFDLQDDLETEEAVSAQKIAELEKRLTDADAHHVDDLQKQLNVANAQVEELAFNLVNANTWLGASQHETARVKQKNRTIVGMGEMAAQREADATAKYNRVANDMASLQERLDATEVAWREHVSKIRQGFGEKVEALRSALSLAEDGLAVGEMGTVDAAMADFRDVLGRREGDFDPSFAYRSLVEQTAREKSGSRAADTWGEDFMVDGLDEGEDVSEQWRSVHG